MYDVKEPPIFVNRYANPQRIPARLPLLLDCRNTIPTTHNLRLSNKTEYEEFRTLLDQKILTPAATNIAYLKAFMIPRRKGARLLVDGNEAKMRGLISPNYPTPMAVAGTFNKLLPFRYFAAIDLSGAYHQVAPIDHIKHLTIRIEGRVFYYNGCPQGLSASPSVCTDVFARVFTKCGATASYMDNAVFAGETREEVQTKLEEGIQYLEKLGLRLSAEQTIPPDRKIPFLGLVLEQMKLSLPNEKKEKLAKLLEGGDKKKLQGYTSYLQDVFSVRERLLQKENSIPIRST